MPKTIATTTNMSAKYPLPFISKSDYLAWRQCPKLAWHRFNAPEELAPPDPAAKALMKQGDEVTRLAWELYPDGLLVGGTGDVRRDIRRTAEKLSAHRPLREATFAAGSAFSRADMLVPAERDAWDLVEVKSTTSVDELHRWDVAFQAQVLKGASVQLRRCHLAHLDRNYVRSGNVEAKKLFAVEDLTAELEEMAAQVEADLPQVERLRQQRQAPAVPVGPHCESPYHCPLYVVCLKRMPAANVFTLYRGGKRAGALYESGITRIDQLPADTP